MAKCHEDRLRWMVWGEESSADEEARKTMCTILYTVELSQMFRTENSAKNQHNNYMIFSEFNVA